MGEKLAVTNCTTLPSDPPHPIQYPDQRLVIGVPTNLRKLAYREVDLLLVGAPLAEGYVLDLYYSWTPAGMVRTTAHLARSQPLGHLSQESLLCLVRANLLCSRTGSHLFIGTHCVAQGCSLEHYEHVVSRTGARGSLRGSVRWGGGNGAAPTLVGASPNSRLIEGERVCPKPCLGLLRGVLCLLAPFLGAAL